MTDAVYCYPPDFTILKNKLDIRDAVRLDRFERRSVTQRVAEGIPAGDFDLTYLRAIHKHLFQDVYDWAGALRTVEISKGGHQFQLRQYIKTGMADVHKRLAALDYLRNLSATEFAGHAGTIIGDVNYVHPFREGNGRVQVLYLEQLAAQAGHRFDVKAIDRSTWMEASRQAHIGNYAPMADAIGVALH